MSEPADHLLDIAERGHAAQLAPDIRVALLSADDALEYVPEADGPAAEHLEEARFHLRHALQLMEAEL